MALHLNTSAAVLIIFLTLSSSPSNPASFNFSSFQSSSPEITLQGHAFIENNAIHLTKELQNEEKTQSCGRVIYKEPVHLWDRASMELADFTTHFTFIMNNLTDDVFSGDGLAFFIAANGSQIPSYYSQGGYLCLFSDITSVPLNSTLSMAPTVAVEFDTYSNTWDAKGETTLDGDHIGIDVNSIMIVVGVVLILAAISGVISMIWFIVWHKRSGGKQENRGIELAIDEEIEQSWGPKRFSFSELSTATNNFSDEGLLGKGGFGSVHKGFLKDHMNIIPVAVKKLSKDSQQGIKEYVSEVRAISQLGHKNLVKLIGWCHEGGEFLLVYNFMPNGSLDLHLFGDQFEPIPWTNRLTIVRGLAAALFYLHEQCEHCVLHRDIKSSNVMLDSNFHAKLGDFGLAREIDHEEDGKQSSLAAGTFGYLAPEYYYTKKATKESDIYSFGIVLLEVACGRKPIDPQRVGEVVMVDWVWNLYGMKQVLVAADDRLNGEFNEDEMECLMVTALWCVHPNPNSRPSIGEVISVLNHDASLPLLPSKMPAAPYSAMSSRSASGVTSSHNGRSQCSSSTSGTVAA